MWPDVIAAVASVLGLSSLAAGIRLLAAWQRVQRDKNIARLERALGLATASFNGGSWRTHHTDGLRHGPRAAADRWTAATTRATQNYTNGIANS